MATPRRLVIGAPGAVRARRATRRAPLLPGLLLLTLLAGGCSRGRLVVTATAPLMDASVEEIFRSGDVETARRGLPGQILLLRGLCRCDPDRLETWTMAAQLYASYAIVFVGEEDPDYAGQLYREGRDLGLRYLRRIAWFDAAWSEGPDELRAQIVARRPMELVPLLTWTAACLGQHVLANQDRPREMLDLPYVHAMIEAAIDLDGGYFYGMPHVVKGMILATVPQGLGGNLEEADRYFRAAMELSGGRFLLHAVLYAQSVCTAALDKERFVATLEEVLRAPEELPEARFMNVVAKERAARLLARRKELF
ncbi:MAG: hypothetical protein FJY75_06225 [Candidatus Eisenbacteria bacterium]|uniref:Uncharacterized protein n=1 Tax=Eiseniibacteriota bacterium TaxID=2212470 RepID=A0A938BQQ0_UNCEI|nr:hypothetical protein [Candidatus Eisenbacteria bacterium]